MYWTRYGCYLEMFEWTALPGIKSKVEAEEEAYALAYDVTSEWVGLDGIYGTEGEAKSLEATEDEIEATLDYDVEWFDEGVNPNE